jgi:hypothetical protein
MQRYDAVKSNDLEKMLYYLCHPLAKTREYDAQEWMLYKESHRQQVSAKLADPFPRWLKAGSERLQSMKAAQLAVNAQAALQAQASAPRLPRATAAVQAGAAVKAIAAAHGTAASMPIHNNSNTNNRRYSGGSTRYSHNTGYNSAADTRYSNSGNGTYNNKFKNSNSSSYNNSGTTFRTALHTTTTTVAAVATTTVAPV